MSIKFKRFIITLLYEDVGSVVVVGWIVVGCETWIVGSVSCETWIVVDICDTWIAEVEIICKIW